MNAITTPRSRSTEFTRHRLATGDGPSPEAPAANSDLVPALIKFTRSFFMGFSTRWRRHAQVTLHVGDGRWEMICGEAVETRGEKGKRRDEPQRFFNAKGQGIEGGHRYSTARGCCAADSSVGRLLTRAVLYRCTNVAWPDLGWRGTVARVVYPNPSIRKSKMWFRSMLIRVLTFSSFHPLDEEQLRERSDRKR